MSRNLATKANAGRKPGKPEDHVGFLLKNLHYGLRQALEEALREQRVGLSFAQLTALFGLLFEPGLTGAQLARRATVSAQTMNSILRRLESDALIERRPHPESRRADAWFLTEDGSEQLAQARAIGDPVFARMLSALSSTEVAELQSYLRRCIAAVEASASERATRRAAASRTVRRASAAAPR